MKNFCFTAHTVKNEWAKKLILTMRFTIFILFLSLFHISASVAQQQTISGKVTDTSGLPLPGVSIVIKGTTQGTVTNVDGEFLLANVPSNATIVFSFVGMLSQEASVANQTVFNIRMEEETIGLEEVIAIGYGTVEKGKLTGSVANVSGTKLEQIRTTNLVKSLQGMVPGLVITDRGGFPGREDVNILVRGTHTLGSNAPLYVIDGVPRSGLGQLSPNDIEDISVLKDASAAIYGARAANGVIIIRTKRGKTGEFRLDVNSDYGINALTRVPKMMDSWQWATYQNEIQKGYGMPTMFSDDDIQKYKDGSNPITHPNTDFYNLAFRNHAPESKHNVSATGGSENIKYFISGDYLQKESQYSSKDGLFKQYQLRSNIDGQINKYLNLGMDVSLRLEDSKMPYESTSNIIHRAYFNYPIEPGFYPNGLPYFTREGGGNPVVMNTFDMGWNQAINKILQTKLSFDFKMDWLTKGLGLIGYAAYDYNIANNEVHHKPALLYKYNQNTDKYDELYSTMSGAVNLAESNSVSRNDLYHIRLYYQNTFENHNVSAFVAYEQSESEYSYLYGYRNKLFSTAKVELFAGEEDGRVVDGTSSVGGRVNYFGHFSYDYMRKYMIDFTLRRDGSYNFAKDKRFGTFPGVSAGWNISKEPFMAGISRVADNIKLRVSYGEMGNDNVPSHQYLTKYGLIAAGSYVFITGKSPAYNAQMDITNVPNPNITWETARTLNYGLDATFLKKLSLSVDYFYEKRRGILIRRSESVPAYTALELPQENLGKVDNSGIEAILNFNDQAGEVYYQIGGNFAFNRSKIVYMDESKDIPDWQRKEGRPVNSFLAYEADGIFRDPDALNNYPHLAGELPGGIRYIDVDGDGKITANDRVRHSTSDIPEIQFGINMSMQYKGLEVAAFFQGATKVTLPLVFNDSGTKPQYLFTERWTENNKDASQPRPYQGYDTFQKLSTFHFNDASYLRLKNLEIAYNFSNAKWLPSDVFKKLRVYARGRNLWTLDHLKTFDPEAPYQEDESRGSRAKYYPQTITYSFGVNITL